PIYNSLESGTYQKFRFEYLADDFDTDISVLDLPIHSKIYDEIDLDDSIYRTETNETDMYAPLKFVFNEKDIIQLKVNIEILSKRKYPDFEEWSLLQVFSHVVYECRPEKEYYDGLINLIENNLEVHNAFLEEWGEIYTHVIESKGVV